MVAFSKIAILGAVSVDAVARGEKKNWLGGAVRTGVQGFMGMAALAQGAPSPLRDIPVTSDLFKASHAANMDDLNTLLEDESAMRARYKQFMTQKYGDQCETGLCASYEGGSSDPKYVAFSYNIALAQERNKHGTGKSMNGITHLMDLSREEFRGMLGYKGEDRYKGVDATDVLKLESTTLKSSKDWRDTAVTPVKDQGQCGSCWAFSTVESMESAAMVAGIFSADRPFIGSPQELVSCDFGPESDDQGCDGGLPANGFKFFAKHGLEPEKDYPYVSGKNDKTGKCHAHYSKGVLEVTKTTQLSIWGVGEDSDMKDYIMEEGPMSVAVAANDAWQTYTGGVMEHSECDDSHQPNHAVQAVALDTEQGYWVVRNSWGADWGEDGFIRMTYNENTCNIASDAMGVEVKKAGDDRADEAEQAEMPKGSGLINV